MLKQLIVNGIFICGLFSLVGCNRGASLFGVHIGQRIKKDAKVINDNLLVQDVKTKDNRRYYICTVPNGANPFDRCILSVDTSTRSVVAVIAEGDCGKKEWRMGHYRHWMSKLEKCYGKKFKEMVNPAFYEALTGEAKQEWLANLILENDERFQLTLKNNELSLVLDSISSKR